MKAKEKIAYIAAGAVVMAAIIEIVPAIINAEAEKVSNTENISPIEIENSEIKSEGGDDSINAVGNNGTINHTNNQPVNNYYYYYYGSNDPDSHAVDDSEKETKEGSEFYTEIKVRVADCDDKTWRSSIYAKVGDIVEFQMQYKNISNESHQQVMIRDVLPQSLKYIDGSTKIYNTKYQDGAEVITDSITDNGINIGNYAAGTNAFIRFRAEVIGDNLAEGLNLLYNWGQVQAGSAEQIILQDDACVIVNHHIN